LVNSKILVIEYGSKRKIMQNLVYTSKNVHGQDLPGIAEADISYHDRGTGTDADRGISPPGWQGGGAPYYQNRSHLIAKSIGGDGRDARNLVTLTDGTNGTIMREIEQEARDILDAPAGQTFHYKAEAMYDAAAYPASGNPNALFPMPSSITVTISSLDGAELYTHSFPNGVLNQHILFSTKPMNKQEVYNQLKAGISYPEAKGYSILTLKELLSDLQATNYKWLTYNLADEGSWIARINGKSWGTGLNPTQPGSDEAYTQTVVELSQSIQAANRLSMLVDPYTPEAIESLIMRVSDAIAAASKIPYMLKDLRPMYRALGLNGRDEYTLVVSNQSTMPGKIVLYQQEPNILKTGAFALAWFAKGANTGTNAKFTWELKYNFIWSEVKEVGPGVICEASQTLDAGLQQNNTITLDKNENGYLFTGQQTDPKYAGSLIINETGLVQANEAAVGIGMSGFGTFVWPTQPNIPINVTPHPEYWIAFGDYQQQEVLDVQRMAYPKKLEYPGGRYKATVTLNADNTWSEVIYS
jgi:rhizosphere induced protein